MRTVARCGLLLLLLLLVLLPGAAPAWANAAEPPAAEPAAADRVVIVGVAGLGWRDVDPAATPELWRLAEESSVGAVSARAARPTTCLLDGWATLGAGNRVRFPGPEDAPRPPEDAPPAYCGPQQDIADTSLDDPAAAVTRIARDDRTLRFGAEPAALGAAVGCAGVVGASAAVAVAAPGVELTRGELADDGGAALFSGCPLSVVALDDLVAAGDPGPERTDTGTEPALRARALAGVDEAVGRVRAAVEALAGETLLLVVGTGSVNDARAQLHVGIASGPGFAGAGWLTSPSTGRAPFVQLIDVAPTALRALGEEIPVSMTGRPMQAAAGRPPLAEAVAELRLANIAAMAHHRSTGIFFWTVVGVLAALVASGVQLLGGLRNAGRRRAEPSARARRVLRGAALTAASLPIGVHLAGLVPWEGAGAPRPALALSVAVATAVVALLAAWGPWGSRPLGPPTAVLVVTLTTLFLDVLTGSRLELNALLGYDAIVAGRFTGYGNLSIGLLSVSSLLLTAALATAAGRSVAPQRSRRVVAVTVLAAGLVTVAMVGAPGLGRDFGGVLAVLPGFLLLAMLLTGVRVTAARLVGVLAAAVATVAAIAVLDWSRPPEQRTHLGRFVEQLGSGEAWTVVSRKAGANLGILLSSPLVWTLPVALVAAWWLIRPGGLLRTSGADGGPAGLASRDVAVLRAGLIAAAASLFLAAAVNDSGVAVPATAAILLVPLLVWLAAAPPGTSSGARERAGGTPASGPVEEPGRVTVVSRGSTVWNA